MYGSLLTPVTPALKNILFATDFSPCSQTALSYARAIAERHNSTVHMVHVVAPEPAVEIMYSGPELTSEQADAETMMENLLASRPFGRVACTTAIKEGPLWQALASLIEEKSIDLIVLGTHGRRGLKKLVLGSVAEEVFRLAPCPVLTVGPHVMPERAAAADFKTILFATDFDSGSQHALAYAILMARANDSRLILLHAVADSLENPDLGLSERRMRELIPFETMQELRPEIITERGFPTETILMTAESKQADLIVMGARHGMPSVSAHLPWAIASMVAGGASCPTLTVRG